VHHARHFRYLLLLLLRALLLIPICRLHAQPLLLLLLLLLPCS
jgi:hypothetical protein